MAKRNVTLGSHSYDRDFGRVDKSYMKETHRLKGCSKATGRCRLYANIDGKRKRLRAAKHKTYVGSKGGVYVIRGGKKRYISKKTDIYTH